MAGPLQPLGFALQPLRPLEPPKSGPEQTPEIEFRSADGFFFAAANGQVFAAKGAHTD